MKIQIKSKIKEGSTITKKQPCFFSSSLVSSFHQRGPNGSGRRVGSLKEQDFAHFQISLSGPSTPPGFGLREAIKTRQSRAYETATFADLIGRSMGGVSLQSFYSQCIPHEQFQKPIHLVPLSLVPFREMVIVFSQY